MRLLSIEQVCKLPDSPSRRTLYNLAKLDVKPAFIHHHNGGTKVNLDDPLWLDYLDKFNKRGKYKPKRKRRLSSKKPPGKKIQKGKDSPTQTQKKVAKKAGKVVGKIKPPKEGDGTQSTEAFDTLSQAAYDAALQTEHLKNEHLRLKNEKLRQDIRAGVLKNEHKEGDLISTKISSFVFFGFLEKAALDLLRMPDKLGVKIDNLVNESSSDKIIKLLKNEITSILHETKKAQKNALECYQKELKEADKQ